MSHANARTNLFARRLIVERVAAGWPPAHVAEQLGVSRSTVYKWLRRHAEGGDTALADRSSRPVRMPQRTSARVEQKVLTRSGSWFKYNDAYIGQGKEKARAYLAENTAIRDEIRDKILASGIIGGKEVAPEPGEEDEGSPDE